MYQIDAIAFVLNWIIMGREVNICFDEILCSLWYRASKNFKEQMLVMISHDFFATAEWCWNQLN